MIGGDCTKPAETTNGGFIDRWRKMKESQTIEMYGRIHSDICNFPLYLLPGFKIQIKLTKDRPAFYFVSNKADAKPLSKLKKPNYSLNESVRILLFLLHIMKF